MVAVAKNKQDFKGFTLKALVADCVEKGLTLIQTLKVMSENFPRKVANEKRFVKNLGKYLRQINRGKFVYEIVKQQTYPKPDTRISIKGLPDPPQKAKKVKPPKSEKAVTKKVEKKTKPMTKTKSKPKAPSEPDIELE
jgi:hypothetical protein